MNQAIILIESVRFAAEHTVINLDCGQPVQFFASSLPGTLANFCRMAVEDNFWQIVDARSFEVISKFR